MLPDFVAGLTLSRVFYREAVQPIVRRAFPDLSYAVALLGPGSEVLGFDDPMSADHDWGPRLQLFLRPADAAAVATRLEQTLAHELPRHVRGFSTHFSAPDPADGGTRRRVPADGGPIRHRVDVTTPAAFVRRHLDFDVAQPLTPVDWLTFSEQRLATFVGGAVFHDGIGLNAIRRRFAYYPRDVWLYLMACSWTRIGEDEHLVGRAGYVGDEIGAAVIAARLVRDVMRLTFLMSRRYAPYPKWLGTGFARLPDTAAVVAALRQVLTAADWRRREYHLCQAYAFLARRHNELGITEPMPERPFHFFGRPFRVIAQAGFSEALRDRIDDPAVKRLPAFGSLDQFSDSTPLVSNAAWRSRVKSLYVDV